jgi:putative transposase
MSPNNPIIHHRRSIRLAKYNYTQPGAYFITLFTHNNEHVFGKVVDKQVILNVVGEILLREWIQLPLRFTKVQIGEMVIMPDHMHGIIILEGDEQNSIQESKAVEEFGKPVPGSIPTIVRSLKASVTRKVNLMRSSPQSPVWQPNYFERVIRNESEWRRIQEYIQNNPIEWED